MLHMIGNGGMLLRIRTSLYLICSTLRTFSNTYRALNDRSRRVYKCPPFHAPNHA